MLALTQAPSGAVAFNLKPNASLKTIQIRHGSGFRLEKKDAPWHLRWFYGVMRKMFGKGRRKIQMRLPGLVWGGIAIEAGLGCKRLISLRYIQLGKVRARVWISPH